MLNSANPLYIESELIIDDKRRIAVNARNLTDIQHQLYKRNYFKRLRPDLSEPDFFTWKEKGRIGEFYLNELRKRLNNEFQRWHIMGSPGMTKNFIKVNYS